MTLESVLEEVKHLSGKKIVLTGGAFDLIHIGHTRFLSAAKSKGDVLIVAIGSDVLVSSRKGKDRPIIPQEQRAEVISALRFVDYVCITDYVHFDVSLVQMIKPDVLVLPDEGIVRSEHEKAMVDIERLCPSVRIEFLHSGLGSLVHFSAIIEKVKEKYS